MKAEDKTLQALALATKFRQLRQEIISSNVANSETPGYKAKRVHFEEALARAQSGEKAIHSQTASESENEQEIPRLQPMNIEQDAQPPMANSTTNPGIPNFPRRVHHPDYSNAFSL